MGGDASFGDLSYGDESEGTIIDEITSLLNVRRTTASEDDWGVIDLHVGELIDPWPETDTDIEAIEKAVLGDRTLVGQVVDAHGRYSVIVYGKSVQRKNPEVEVPAQSEIRLP